MYQTQLLLADSGRKGTGISIARDGRVFASVRSKGLVALSPGGGVYPIDVSSLMPDPVAFISAAVAPDGSVVFVSVDGKGIWSAPLEASNKRLSVGQCLVPPEAVSMASHRRLLRMHATDQHLYFWSGDTKVMRVVLRSGRVEEVMRVPADTKLEYPSWVLHSPSQGTDTLYFKTNGHSPTVDVIPVGRPTARSSVVTFRGYKGMVACDGDAKLVCDVPSASSRPAHGTYMLEVWDPAQPQAPPVPPARDASSNGATWDVFKDSCPLFRAAHAAVGPSGEVWVWDEWDLDNGCSLARVVRVPATLTPPAAMVPPASHAPASWEVVGSGTELSRDFGTLLASGDGADVTIRVAGGHKLRAHSPVLAARWEWWRGRQNCAPGTSTSAEVVLEDVTPQAAQALLQFLYTGRASLVCEAGCDQDQQGQGHAAASPSEPASKRARRDQGRAGAGASSSANDASAAVSEGAAPATLLQQVLHVATAYCVPSLRAACLELAAQRINVHSALPWLVFAHEQREQQPELKQLAMNWAVAHYAEIKEQAPDTLDVLNPLVRELLDAMHAACARQPGPSA